MVFKTYYCLMQVKSIAECSLFQHSAIFSTFIELPVVIKTFVLSIFEWLFYTGFTVLTSMLSSSTGGASSPFLNASSLGLLYVLFTRAGCVLKYLAASKFFTAKRQMDYKRSTFRGYLYSKLSLGEVYCRIYGRKLSFTATSSPI